MKPPPATPDPLDPHSTPGGTPPPDPSSDLKSRREEDPFFTDEPLLNRIRQLDDRVSWKDFYDFYAPMILRYAEKLGLSSHDGEEIVQDTMTTLVRKLPTFQYDRNRGKFRNLLLTYAHRKALRKFKKLRRNVVDFMPGPVLDALLLNQEALLGAKPEPEDDPAWAEALLEQAILEVRQHGRLRPRTWQIFEDYVLKRRPCAEVVQRHGGTANVVYQIRDRVLKMIRAAAADLGLKTRPVDEQADPST